jgi:hypothetical protein
VSGADEELHSPFAEGTIDQARQVIIYLPISDIRSLQLLSGFDQFLDFH